MSDEERLARRVAPSWSPMTAVLAWCGDTKAMRATGNAVCPEWNCLGTHQAMAFIRGRHMTDPARLVAYAAMVGATQRELGALTRLDARTIEVAMHCAAATALGKPSREASGALLRFVHGRHPRMWRKLGEYAWFVCTTDGQANDLMSMIDAAGSRWPNAVMPFVTSEVTRWARQIVDGFALQSLDAEAILREAAGVDGTP